MSDTQTCHSEGVEISLDAARAQLGDSSYNWLIHAPMSVTSESLTGTLSDVLHRVSELYGTITWVEQAQFGSKPRWQFTMGKPGSTVPIHITAVSRSEGSGELRAAASERPRRIPRSRNAA